MHSDRSSVDGFKPAFGYSSRMNISSNVTSVKPTPELPEIRMRVAQDQINELADLGDMGQWGLDNDEGLAKTDAFGN